MEIPAEERAALERAGERPAELERVKEATAGGRFGPRSAFKYRLQVGTSIGLARSPVQQDNGDGQRKRG